MKLTSKNLKAKRPGDKLLEAMLKSNFVGLSYNKASDGLQKKVVDKSDWD